MGNDLVYAFQEINPVSKYHTLVIPKKHYENVFDIGGKEMKEVALMLRKLSRIYQSQLGTKIYKL